MERCAIIGFGCAGYHGAKALRTYGYTGEIHVFTEDSEAPVNPMLTTYVAGGKLDAEDGFSFGRLEEIAGELDLKVHVGKVRKVCSDEMAVETEDGRSIRFDKILIATGADAFVPDMEGRDNENVFVMRTRKDSRMLRDRLEGPKAETAMVVGASMAGIKVAEILADRGIHCILNDSAPHIFPLAALEPVAQEIEQRISSRGIQLVFGAGIRRVMERGKGIAVELTDDRVFDCDFLVLCIGTRAATAILDSKIQVNRGILVDETMETSVKGIYAAGDCAEGKNLQTGQPQLIGLWANAACQGRCAGSNMAGMQAEYEGNIIHNITHFMDMDFVSLGDRGTAGEQVVFKNPNKDLMIAAVVKDGACSCINVLGNHENTGIIKSAFMKQMRGSDESLDLFMEEKLRRQGVDPAFIRILGGARNG